MLSPLGPLLVEWAITQLLPCTMPLTSAVNLTSFYSLSIVCDANLCHIWPVSMIVRSVLTIWYRTLIFHVYTEDQFVLFVLKCRSSLSGSFHNPPPVYISDCSCTSWPAFIHGWFGKGWGSSLISRMFIITPARFRKVNRGSQRGLSSDRN